MTPVMFMTDAAAEGGKVYPFRKSATTPPEKTEKTDLDLQREGESSTEHIIDFLEKRKEKRKHQQKQNEKLQKYQKWLGIFSEKKELAKGGVLDKTI